MFKDIINEICVEFDIDMKIASKEWMIILTKNNITKYILGNKFDLNSYALGRIFDDKYATYEMLKNLNIPVAKHQILFRSDNLNEFASGCNSYKNAIDFYEAYNQNIVVKSNEGSQGKTVYHITSKSELKNVLDNLFKEHYSISLCPYYEIKNEYRVIMLDGKAMLIYKKVRPVIEGDGHSTIKQLLAKMNPHFFENNEEFNELDKVLKKSEKYEYNWQFNLSKGATMSLDVNNHIKDKILNIASSVYEKTNLRFASIDIIETNKSFMILEINCGVSLYHFSQSVPHGYEIAKNIYKEAIIKMFNL